MARFTMTIGEIADKYNIFDFSYDVPQGITKERLEEAFISQYAYREIAFETYEIWKIKFRFLWLQSIDKYRPLFNKVVDIYNTYRNTHVGETETMGQSSSENKAMPTPVSQEIDGNFIPSEYGVGSAESSGESRIKSVTERQNKTDVELIRDYIKTYQTALNAFLNEFKVIMLKLY